MIDQKKKSKKLTLKGQTEEARHAVSTPFPAGQQHFV